MSATHTHPGTRSNPGSPMAKASAAGAVIALAAAIAGTALAAGIATGAAIEAPAPPSRVQVTQPVSGSTPPVTVSQHTQSTANGGSFDPLRVE